MRPFIDFVLDLSRAHLWITAFHPNFYSNKYLIKIKVICKMNTWTHICVTWATLKDRNCPWQKMHWRCTLEILVCPAYCLILLFSHHLYCSSRSGGDQDILASHSCWALMLPIISHTNSLQSFGSIFQMSANFDVIFGNRTNVCWFFFSFRYPVILSIENHCTIQQQKKIAQYLREIFGNKLDVGDVLSGDSKTLPSPQSLQGKILIKVRSILWMVRWMSGLCTV